MLSFTYNDDYNKVEKNIYLGDIVISVEKIQTESIEQNKDIMFHFTHLLTHGMLHLLGYDHEKPSEAEDMEKLEILILRRLGYKNPYL